MDHNSVLKDTSLGSASISLAPLEHADAHECEAPLSRQGHVYIRLDWQPHAA